MLYKFRDWGNNEHKKILTKNQIFFAQPSSFNDPFDCHIDENFTILSELEIENYIEEQIDFHVLENTFDIQQEFRLRIFDLEFLNKKQNENFKIQDKHIGVFSCNQDTENQLGWQNILMWSHYANNHKGFCVGFDKEKTHNWLKSKHITGGPVYYDKYPEIKQVVPIAANKEKTKEYFKNTISNKATNWNYENEYRFVKINIKNNFEIGLRIKDRIEELTADCYVEVTLGLETSLKHEKKIAKECRKRGILLYKAVKIPFQFGINRVQIL